MKFISLGVIMFPSKATSNLTKTLVLGMGNLSSSCWSWETKSPQNNTNYCCRKHTHTLDTELGGMQLEKTWKPNYASCQGMRATISPPQL